MEEKFLKFFGVESEKNDGETDEESELGTIDLIEMELNEAISELAVKHIDTDEYTKGVNNVKTLSEAFEKVSKAEAELNKAKNEDIQTKDKRKIDWSIVGPKVAGVITYGVVMITFIAIEREHPPAMRLVQAANSLLNPKI